MKSRFSINTKLIVYVLSISIAVYLTAIGYLSLRTKKSNYTDAIRLADSYSAQYANLSKVSLNSYMSSVKTIVDIFQNYNEIPEPIRRKTFSDILQIVLRSNTDFLSTWSGWEPRSIDDLDLKYKNTVGSTVLGNFDYMFFKDGSQIILSTFIEQDSAKALSGMIYNMLKQNPREVILDPYYYSYTGKDENRILETSMAAPIMVGGKFRGTVGVDVPLDNFQKMIENVHPFRESYGVLLSNNGIIIAHPNGDMIGKNIGDINRDDEEKNHFLQKILDGKQFSFIGSNPNGSEYYMTFHPVKVGETETSWSLGIIVPLKVVKEVANANFFISMMVGFFGLIILSIVILFISRNITRPIIKTTGLLRELALGDFNVKKKLEIKLNDEIGLMADSVNHMIDGLHQTALFARQIGQGNLEAEFTPLSENDVLGNSLLEMRKSLKHAEDLDHKRKEEDERQRWVSEGLSKINDILRGNNKLSDLSFKLMTFLIDYTQSCQGAIYVVNNSDPNNTVLELINAIAFGRHRLMKKEILPGEGLVGRCFVELIPIYMTDIPDEYTLIRSGLGGAKPKCLFIVPLKLNDSIFGVIELISFKNIEDYKHDFVEKAGEAIASAISMAKINEQTERLLSQSREQADELSQAEEEMRQNLEEMSATQEESSKRESKLNEIMETLGEIALITEFSMDGKIIDVNQNFLNLVNLAGDSVMGRKQNSFDEFKNFDDSELWYSLRAGNAQKRTHHVIVRDKNLWFSEIYKPIFDRDGNPFKIMKIAIDITNQVKSKVT